MPFDILAQPEFPQGIPIMIPDYDINKRFDDTFVD